MASTPPFRSAHRWARGAKGLLLTQAVAMAAGIFDSVLYLAATWHRAQANGIPDWIGFLFRLSFAARMLALPLLLVATAIVFLVWCYKAQRNLPMLGNEQLTYGPWTSVICYFVPIANLFWPVLTMRQLWHGSDPANFAAPAGYYGSLQRRKQKTPSLVWWWWALFVLYNVLSGAEQVREGLARRPFDAASSYSIGVLLVVAWTIGLAAAVVARRMVSTIDTFQRQRWAALQSHDAASLRH